MVGLSEQKNIKPTLLDNITELLVPGAAQDCSPRTAITQIWPDSEILGGGQPQHCAAKQVNNDSLKENSTLLYSTLLVFGG